VFLVREVSIWNEQVSGGVIGRGIEVEDWSQVYMGYFTVRIMTLQHKQPLFDILVSGL
jgi:hypothetical protein